MIMTPIELRSARLALGLTQAEFARLSGQRRETVSNKERGNPRYPIQQSDETIIRLARGENLDALLRELA